MLEGNKTLIEKHQRNNNVKMDIKHVYNKCERNQTQIIIVIELVHLQN